MKLLNFFKTTTQPYKDDSSNLSYELLFYDNRELHKHLASDPEKYPWKNLFAAYPSVDDLQQILADSNVDTGTKILAYHQLAATGHPGHTRELLAVIVEIGLDTGLNVMASYQDGSIRYINHTGGLLVWEASDETTRTLTQRLFAESEKAIEQTEIWTQPRMPHPETDQMRVTFLVSGDLCFDEGPSHVLFNNPLAGPVLDIATELIKHLMYQSMGSELN